MWHACYTELMADVEKAVGKVADQEEVIGSVTDQLRELTGALTEQGEDLHVLLSENAHLRAQIDRASRVSAAAALTRDRDKSTAWTKEVRPRRPRRTRRTFAWRCRGGCVVVVRASPPALR